MTVSQQKTDVGLNLPLVDPALLDAVHVACVENCTDQSLVGQQWFWLGSVEADTAESDNFLRLARDQRFQDMAACSALGGGPILFAVLRATVEGLANQIFVLRQPDSIDENLAFLMSTPVSSSLVVTQQHTPELSSHRIRTPRWWHLLMSVVVPGKVADMLSSEEETEWKQKEP